MMAWRIELPADEIVARYEAGESARGLGQAYGVSRGTVQRRLLAADVTMRPRGRPWGWFKRGGPLSINHGRLGTRDCEGKPQYIHRGCWEACCGPVPDDYVVHHIDGDRMNNEIENLACLPHGEHTRLHAEKRRGTR